MNKKIINNKMNKIKDKIKELNEYNNYLDNFIKELNKKEVKNAKIKQRNEEK